MLSTQFVSQFSLGSYQGAATHTVAFSLSPPRSDHAASRLLTIVLGFRSFSHKEASIMAISTVKELSDGSRRVSTCFWRSGVELGNMIPYQKQYQFSFGTVWQSVQVLTHAVSDRALGWSSRLKKVVLYGEKTRKDTRVGEKTRKDTRVDEKDKDKDKQSYFNQFLEIVVADE
ncbi:hypothetical protein FCM35_KLT02652 [Carex littledalei]|uniref:Uncharacterized protein n=1 Tax=Carex littledalei TaxID=544730 RepID=A0A833VMM0_9POAL|nr:hypothetical protein FCM35_KLT02652 [Carex littledalei]